MHILKYSLQMYDMIRYLSLYYGYTKDFPKERYCTPYLSLVPKNVNLK